MPQQILAPQPILRVLLEDLHHEVFVVVAEVHGFWEFDLVCDLNRRETVRFLRVITGG